MEELGKIEIRVSDQVGSEPLSPENFDIQEIKVLFDVVENLLYPNQKIGRTPITYSMGKGSVRNIFKTTPQRTVMFLTIMAMVSKSGNLEGLELPVAPGCTI